MKKYYKVINGKVTLPAELRKKYNIKPGMKIFFVEKENGIYLRKGNSLNRKSNSNV